MVDEREKPHNSSVDRAARILFPFTFLLCAALRGSPGPPIMGGVPSALRLRPARCCRGWPRADPLPQRDDLTKVICVMYRHAVELIAHGQPRLHLQRQTLRLLAQRCRSAGAVQELFHEVVPLLLVLGRRAREELTGRICPLKDTLLVPYNVPELLIDRMRCAVRA